MNQKTFYKSENDKQTCLLCQHYCKISEGKTGICGVNKNVGDKIECLVYGYPAAMNIDPTEKKPLYHFLPQTKTFSIGTVGCNFKCSFCQNHGISQEQNVNKNKYWSPEDIVNTAIKNNCNSISYTYNEPTIFFPYIRDISTLAHSYGLKNVMVSNGFESFEVIEEMEGLIDAVNIDLKSWNKDYYKKELGGNLEKLLNNLKLMKSKGIWIEITTLIIPQLNDSKEELNQIAQFIKEELGEETPWHLSAFHPDYKMLDKPRTSIDSLNIAYDIGKKNGLKYVYRGNAGLENNTDCLHCNELLLQRVNYQTKIDKTVNNSNCPKCNTKLPGVFLERKIPSVAGTFYSNNCKEIEKQFNYFNDLLSKSNFKKPTHINPQAIIVPHAGYIYSGFTANVAYNTVMNKSIDTVVVIGPSHKYPFNGVSVSLQDEYLTPCGSIKIDKENANKIIKENSFCHYDSKAHMEHSTETQALFIKAYFPKSKIIEIVYGREEYSNIENIIKEVIENPNMFLVVSTDLSHFYDINKANQLDNLCLHSIDKLDLNIWNKGCEACGRVGVKALISYAKKNNLSSQILDYRTSMDITKDSNRVVGYMSAIIGKKV